MMDSAEARHLFDVHAGSLEMWAREVAFKVPDWIEALWARVLSLAGSESIEYVDGRRVQIEGVETLGFDLAVFTTNRVIRARVKDAGPRQESKVWAVARSSLVRVDADGAWGLDDWPPAGLKVTATYADGDSVVMPNSWDKRRAFSEFLPLLLGDLDRPRVFGA